jgi:glyoxylase-like metal-dependent hydrolase (beta-lactamase superfamily II)
MSVLDDLDPVTRLGDGIDQIRLPMAGNPMRYINAYLIAEDDGFTLIDCGWKADDVLAALHDGLARVGTTLSAVKRLAITHFHFDHYGLAGTLMRAGVPALAMHPNEWRTARAHLEDAVAADASADAWIARNGYVLATDESLDDELHYRRTELAEPTRLLEDGERLGRLRAVFTPGHTSGHLCFVDERTGAMFVGDHVLDPVTPHVGIWFEQRGDALGEYVASLHAVRALGATRVLPAHGEPFDDLARRVDQLLAHTHERETQVLAALTNGPLDAGGVARALGWTRRNRRFDELGPMHQQFAVAETIAHLEYARGRALVERIGDHPIVYRVT